MTIEVCDILIDHLLPQKADGIVPKKIIPQMPFFFGHVFAERFRIGRQFCVVLSVFHSIPQSGHCVSGQPPLGKGAFSFGQKSPWNRGFLLFQLDLYFPVGGAEADLAHLLAAALDQLRGDLVLDLLLDRAAEVARAVGQGIGGLDQMVD